MSRRVCQLYYEQLEPRQLLATDFFGVGYFYEASLLDGLLLDDGAYVMEGEIDQESMSISGRVTPSDWNGPGTPFDFPGRNIAWLGDGRYFVEYDAGAFQTAGLIPTYGNAVQFLSSRGYPIGWSVVDYAGPALLGTASEVNFLVERPTSAALSDFQGHWEIMSVFSSTNNDFVVNASGVMGVVGNNVSVSLTGPGGSATADTTITLVQQDGMAFSADGDRFLISKDKSIAMIVDLTESDDIVVAVAYRPAPSVSVHDVAGRYRMGVLMTGSLAFSVGGTDAYVADMMLNLDPSGIYVAEHLDSYDAGLLDPTDVGTWSVVGNRIRFEGLFGGVTEMTVGENGALFLATYEGQPTMGVATRAIPRNTPTTAGSAVISVTHFEGSAPTLFELGDDHFWRKFDLSTITGSSATEVVSWIDPKDGRSYAAGITAGGVVLIKVEESGLLTARNLTTALGGAAITSELEVIIGADGTVHLFGLNADGDLLRYSQTGDTTAGQFDWAFRDVVAQDLEPFGQVMPEFVGDIVSYATSWGGLNIAGLDANGNIWSVWWAPGLQNWFATDLTSSFNAQPLVGGLTVYLTSWDGINIAGVDAAGQARVAWWVPSFAGDWQHTNLTAEVGGAGLAPNSVSSYVSSWGGLNIVGKDRNTGEITVYWWAPARTALGWARTSLTQTVGSNVPYLQLALIGAAAPDGSLNVFGQNDDGDLLRYFWYPGFGGNWLVENLSLSSIDP